VFVRDRQTSQRQVRKTDIMGARGSTQLALTPKGVEELALRTHRLDSRLRNILFLVQKGTPTIEAILQNSIFPHEEVVEKLRGLLKERFVEMVSGLSVGAAAAPTAAPPKPRTLAGGGATAEIPLEPPLVAAPPTVPTSAFPTLDSGISMSQARFELCDFCLDQFGTNAQPLLDAIEEAANVAELQHLVDGLTAQMRKHLKDKLPALLAKVREINETAV
jgi:hypothetical protein